MKQKKELVFLSMESNQQSASTVKTGLNCLFFGSFAAHAFYPADEASSAMNFQMHFTLGKYKFIYSM